MRLEVLLFALVAGLVSAQAHAQPYLDATGIDPNSLPAYEALARHLMGK